MFTLHNTKRAALVLLIFGLLPVAQIGCDKNQERNIVASNPYLTTIPVDSLPSGKDSNVPAATATTYPNFCFALSVPWLCQLPPGTDWGLTNNCGQACCAMLGGYFNNRPISASTIDGENTWLGCPKPYGCGTGNGTIQRLLSGYHGLQSAVYNGSTPAEPVSEASRNRPPIVGVNIYKGNLVPAGYVGPDGKSGRSHWVIVVGWDGSNVVVHDPGTGTGAYRKYSVAAFDASWTTSGRTYIPVWK